MTFLGLIVKSLMRQRVRSVLTLTGIAIAITTVVALGVITAGMRATADAFVQAGTADFMAAQEGAADLSFSTLPESVVQVDDPESALPRPVVTPPPPTPPRRQVDLGLDVAVDPLAFAGAAITLAVHGALERGALRVELALAQQLPTTLAGARVGTLIPELAGSAWADATVGQVFDMTDGVRFTEVYTDPKSDIFAYVGAMGWAPDLVDPNDPTGILRWSPR